MTVPRRWPRPLRPISILVLVLALGLPLAVALVRPPWSPAAAAEDLDFRPIVATIVADGEAVLAAYRPAAGPQAADRFSALYFDVFEASGMELAVSKTSEETKVELEGLFSDVIGATLRSAPREEVAPRWRALRDRLTEVAEDRERQAAERRGGLRGLLPW
jgi:high-affinity iron transporter